MRSVTRWAVIVVLSGGCPVHPSPSSNLTLPPPQARLLLRVENSSAHPVDIFLVWHGTRARLETVDPHTSAIILVPVDRVGSIAHLEVMRAAAVEPSATREVHLMPGVDLRLTVRRQEVVLGVWNRLF